MIQPNPPFGFFMGGEQWSDDINACTVIFGADAVDDGNFPGYTVPNGVAGPDDLSDSVEPMPKTIQFVAEGDKPQGPHDYPLRMCSTGGEWGAPSAMCIIDGKWYLQRNAPDPKSDKKYPPENDQRGR